MTDVAEPGRCDQEPDLAPTGASTAAAARSRKGAGGPKTAEGKARSARNALKHGLRARTHVPEELARRAEDHAENLARELKPQTPHQAWLVRRAALAAARLDRIEELEAEIVRDRVERAEACWDDDRRDSAEEIGARLAKDPPGVVARLHLTRQGVEWLITRWEGLDAVLSHRGSWTDAQRRLVLDLLGTPVELREGSPIARPEASRGELAALVARQLRTLRAALEGRLAERDRFERRLARDGYFLRDDAQTRALRRYEAEQARALAGALREFRRLAPPSSSRPRRDPTLRGTPLHGLAFGTPVTREDDLDPRFALGPRATAAPGRGGPRVGGLPVGIGSRSNLDIDMTFDSDSSSGAGPEPPLPPWLDVARVTAEFEAAEAQAKAAKARPGPATVAAPGSGPNRRARRRLARDARR